MAKNDSGRIVLIFAAVALAAGGGGFYFVKVYKPKAALAAARADVTAWDTRYAAARACLLGPTPASSVTSEALAVREMSPDPWDRGKCTPLVSKLARDAANSGIDEVEHAWDALDAASTHAAQAFATHVATATRSESLKDPLPEALDALDGARGKLFAAVELSVPMATGKPLPTAQILPLRDGAEPVIELDITPPSQHGAVWFGKTATHLVQMTLPTGGTPVVARVGPSTIRAVPVGRGGASGTATGVQVGALDAEGAMTASHDSPLPNARVVAVGGSRDHGIVVFGNDNQLVFAEVTADGVKASPAMTVQLAAGTMDTDGTVGVWWLDKNKAAAARRWSAGQLQEVLILGAAQPSEAAAPCLTSDRLGVGVGAEDEWGATPLLGCSATSVLVGHFDTEPNKDRLRIYGATPRDVDIASMKADRATIALLDGKLVAYTSHNGAIGTLREDGTRAFYAIPRGVQLTHPHMDMMASTDGKVVDLLAQDMLASDNRAYVIVRVPASGR
jgi:hypothetical protein